MRPFRVCAVVWLCFAFQSLGQSSQEIGLPTLDKFELHNVKAESVTYRGHAAIRITDVGAADVDDASGLVIPGSSFQDGTIEVDLSGDTAPNAPEGLRGFVGISFRVSSDRSHFERFYLRPKNGRSNDQLQRNHSAQYVSAPGFPWQKLRTESPGKYECRFGARTVDAHQNNRCRNYRTTVCQRLGSANPHGERPETASSEGCNRALDRAGDHRSFFRSQSYTVRM